MPNFDGHCFQATHNLSFLELFYLKTDDFNDWVITVSFYSSLHIIECTISMKKTIIFMGKSYTIEHSNDLSRIANKTCQNSAGGVPIHDLRKAIVNENFSEIFNDYNFLYNQSITSRYYKYQFQNIY